MDCTVFIGYFDQTKFVYDNDMLTIITRDFRGALGLALIPYQ